jgi:hypothetical protein
MKLKNSSSNKCKNTLNDFFFYNQNKFNKVFLSGSIFSREGNLFLKYLEFYLKEIFYNSTQKILLRKVLETLTINSFFLKKNSNKILYGVFLFITNHFYSNFRFLPQPSTMKINGKKYLNSSNFNQSKNFYHNLLRNKIIRKVGFLQSISQLKIKLCNNLNFSQDKSNNSPENNNIILFKRLNYTKKNKKLRYFVNKIFTYYRIFNNIDNLNGKSTIWVSNTLILNTIEGKEIQSFWFFLKPLQKKFQTFKFLDNYYQIFLPINIILEREKNLNNKGFILKIGIENNLKIFFRFMSIFKHNTTMFQTRNKNLFFFFLMCSDIKVKKNIVFKLLTINLKLFKKTRSYQWFCLKNKIFLFIKKDIIAFSETLIGLLFFKGLLFENSNFKITKQKIFHTKKKINISKKHLWCFPQKIFLITNLYKNTLSKVFSLNKHKPNFLSFHFISQKKFVFFDNLFYIGFLKKFKKNRKIGNKKKWTFINCSNNKKNTEMFISFLIKYPFYKNVEIFKNQIFTYRPFRIYIVDKILLNFKRYKVISIQETKWLTPKKELFINSSYGVFIKKRNPRILENHENMCIPIKRKKIIPKKLYSTFSLNLKIIDKKNFKIKNITDQKKFFLKNFFLFFNQFNSESVFSNCAKLFLRDYTRYRNTYFKQFFYYSVISKFIMINKFVSLI